MQNSEILKEAHRFYSHLYTKESTFLPLDSLDETPLLTQGESDIMSADLTMVELHSALNLMKPTSAPGSYGITVKFYLHFLDIVKEDLFNCLEYSFEEGKLSQS